MEKRIEEPRSSWPQVIGALCALPFICIAMVVVEAGAAVAHFAKELVKMAGLIEAPPYEVADFHVELDKLEPDEALEEISDLEPSANGYYLVYTHHPLSSGAAESFAVRILDEQRRLCERMGTPFYKAERDARYWDEVFLFVSDPDGLLFTEEYEDVARRLTWMDFDAIGYSDYERLFSLDGLADEVPIVETGSVVYAFSPNGKASASFSPPSPISDDAVESVAFAVAVGQGARRVSDFVGDATGAGSFDAGRDAVPDAFTMLYAVCGGFSAPDARIIAEALERAGEVEGSHYAERVAALVSSGKVDALDAISAAPLRTAIAAFDIWLAYARAFSGASAVRADLPVADNVAAVASATGSDLAVESFADGVPVEALLEGIG